MAGTPDRHPGPLVEEEIQLEDRTADGEPTEVGAIRRLGDRILFRRSSEQVVDLYEVGNVIFAEDGSMTYVMSANDMGFVTQR